MRRETRRTSRGRAEVAATRRNRGGATSPFRVERNEHGAHIVLCGGCALGAETDRAAARALAARLALDPEAGQIVEVASSLPEGTKVWRGAVGAVVARGHGRDATDYADACWWLWSKVRSAREALGSRG